MPRRVLPLLCLLAGLACVSQPPPTPADVDAAITRADFADWLGGYTLETRRETLTRTVRKGIAILEYHWLGDDGELAIVVRDTGIGIPRGELDKVFEEFYQVDHGPQRPEGLGLGLSIVRRLAALLRHEIDVESDVGEGTSFTVTLPRAAIEATDSFICACA